MATLVAVLTVGAVLTAQQKRPKAAEDGATSQDAASAAGLPAALARADAARPGTVEAEMRHVLYRVDDQVVLDVQRLRGVLRPTTAGKPPWFEDAASFGIEIDTGEVAVSTASLTAILNRYVFNYAGSPITDLRLTIRPGELEQTGKLHKGLTLPFRIKATVAATPDGRIRLHPTSVKVAGVGVTRLMRTFGLELEKMVKVRGDRGVQVDGNDFVLNATGMLPPPRISGKVVSASPQDGRIVLAFGRSSRSNVSRLSPSDPSARNYMFFRGGVLRFGKLTMDDADLQIVDGDPKDAFDFYLSRLNEQLVAGYSKNQRDFGLMAVFPDYGDLGKKASTLARR